MITITIIQGIIFITYVTFLLLHFKGPLNSISESWYELKGNYKHLFTLFCWSLGFLMVFQTNGDTGLFVLSGGGLLFVGAATMFKTDEAKSNIIHPLGALAAISGALVGLIVERHAYVPFISFIVLAISIYLLVKNNKIWWIEISAFLSIILGLLFF
jgi:hypothetical protein